MLLVACGILYLTLGDVHEGLMLLGFVFVIIAIEFYQEKKTEKALDALKDLASPRALVISDGLKKRIAGPRLVEQVFPDRLGRCGSAVSEDHTTPFAHKMPAECREAKTVPTARFG